MSPPAEQPSLADAVVATVAYADVFDMPIEHWRLHRFLLGVAATREEVDAVTGELVVAGRLRAAGGLVHLPEREKVLAIHADRVDRAAEMWRDARRWGARLGRLPFVRMVAVTGGLACDSVAAHDDIDFLLVARPGRVWLARLGCVAIVRAARLSGLDLCPNYVLAETALALDEHTPYTARELAQTVPITGLECWQRLRDANPWVTGFLPNAGRGDTSHLVSVRTGLFARVVEVVLGASVFDRVERWEMERKVRRLTRVSSRRAEVGCPDESAFSPDRCKGHLEGNASGIEVAWAERLANHGLGAPA